RQYTNWACRIQTSKHNSNGIKSAFIRLFINGILVAVIFTVAGQVIYPHIPFLTPDTMEANSMELFIALIFASPFIWGMMFSYKTLNLTNGSKPYLHPAVLLIWLITVSEITLLSIIDFNSWLAIGVFVILATLFFAVLFRQLEKSYGWFERQLMENIDLGHHDKSHVDTGALKDIHFVTLKVNEFSEYADKSISE